MSRDREWYPDRNDVICEEYESGASLRELAAEHKISHERVRQVLIQRGVDVRRQGAPILWTEDRLRRLVASVRAGIPLSRLEGRFGVSAGALREALRNIGEWPLTIALLALLLTGCTLTPSRSPARFHMAGWCPVESEAVECDAGAGVSMATWLAPDYGRYLSAVAVLGGDTLGGGLSLTLNRGTERMPLLAVGVGGVCRYDASAGVDLDQCAPVIGATAGWGRE